MTDPVVPAYGEIAQIRDDLDTTRTEQPKNFKQKKEKSSAKRTRIEIVSETKPQLIFSKTLKTKQLHFVYRFQSLTLCSIFTLNTFSHSSLICM